MNFSARRLLKAALLFSLLAFVGFVVTGHFSEAQSATKAKRVRKSGKKAAKQIKKIDPNDPTSVIYLGTSGELAGVGDPSHPPSFAYKKGHGWHPAALEAQGLPRDRYGLIDWAKIVREKLIDPKFSLDPKNDSEMPPLDMNVLIQAKGDFVDNVIYPHEIHTYWLKCEVCHPKIFIPAKGQNNMTMVGIVKGKWCGRCHNRVAFPLTDCKRCHSSPKPKK
ncbi:MAG: c(7)-type cytochrome triheme domain-containing protein [Thermodesulfobacteriota bacterium]